MFLDGDYSDYPDEMEDIILPIVKGDADLVVGSRIAGSKDKKSENVKKKTKYNRGLSVRKCKDLFCEAECDVLSGTSKFYN